MCVTCFNRRLLIIHKCQLNEKCIHSIDVTIQTLPADYTTKKPANICGNALLNITPSSDYGLPSKDHQHARISSAWAHVFAIPVKRNSRQPFRVELAAPYNSNDGPPNVLRVVNRCVSNMHF